jgi:protein-disulfide isomerase
VLERRLVLGGLFAFAGFAARADVPNAEPDDMALGRRTAPVTVIEYASLGCSHCATWRREVFPLLKRQYIDTGKVRFVVREMLNGDHELATLGWLLARCDGGRRYFEVMDRVYAAQETISEDRVIAKAAVANVARSIHLSDAKFNACMADIPSLQAVLGRNQRHKFTDGVTITPTFFVNGQRHEGEIPFMELDQMIQLALSKSHVPGT